MAHRFPKYDAYRPGATDRLASALQRGDRYTPDTEGTSAESNDSPVAPWNPSYSPNPAPHATRHQEARVDSYMNTPRVYDPAIDGLIGRTIRAYYLVVDYQRACPEGRRWSTEHIEMIRHAGEHLDSDRAALREMRATLTQGGDAVPVSKIRYKAKKLRTYCLEIQDLIKVHEQVPSTYLQAHGKEHARRQGRDRQGRERHGSMAD